VPPRTCAVSFIDPGGVRHEVKVEAETLFEAAAMGISRLKRDGWSEGLGPATRLEVEVREPSVTHSVTVKQVRTWAEATAVAPADKVRKNAVREMLG
jgi:hypothetical protein